MCICVSRQTPAQGNACIIHDGMEGLARTQCLVRGQTVGTVMVAGMVQPKVLMRLEPSLAMVRKRKNRISASFKAFGGFLTLVE